MKKLKLFMLGVMLSQMAFAMPPTYRIVYTHDNAGNLVSRVKTLYQRRAKALQEEDATLVNGIENDTKVSVKTDATWHKVQVDIMGEVSQGDVLSVYSADGVLFATIPLETNSVTLDLSQLHRGTYVFKFSVNKKPSERKIFKTN